VRNVKCSAASKRGMSSPGAIERTLSGLYSSKVSSAPLLLVAERSTESAWTANQSDLGDANAMYPVSRISTVIKEQLLRHSDVLGLDSVIRNKSVTY
jgi:hypothetical protein